MGHLDRETKCPSITHFPESYCVCFVETKTHSYILWISVSAKFGFGLLSQVTLVLRLEYPDRNSFTAWEVSKLICSLGLG